MRLVRSTFVPILLVVLLAAVPARAECNCRGGAPSLAPVPMFTGPTAAYTMPSAPQPYGPTFAPYAEPPVGPPSVDQAACGGRCNIGRFDAPVPPGTLGRTYDLCSRPLPEDAHPRNAGLEIRSADVTRIDVERMDGYLGEDGLWHFLSEKPWIPGRPAIVTVVIERVTDGTPIKDVRIVRLIPGRILSLEF
jgi:hypothetical protein